MRGALALRKPVGTPLVHDNAVNIAANAYTELSATTDAPASALEVYNTSSKAIILAVGAAGVEVDKVIVGPGALGIIIPWELGKAKRLAAKAVGAAATTGFLVVNLLA